MNLKFVMVYHLKHGSTLEDPDTATHSNPYVLDGDLSLNPRPKPFKWGDHRAYRCGVGVWLLRGLQTDLCTQYCTWLCGIVMPEILWIC